MKPGLGSERAEVNARARSRGGGVGPVGSAAGPALVVRRDWRLSRVLNAPARGRSRSATAASVFSKRCSPSVLRATPGQTWHRYRRLSPRDRAECRRSPGINPDPGAHLLGGFTATGGEAVGKGIPARLQSWHSGLAGPLQCGVRGTGLIIALTGCNRHLSCCCYPRQWLVQIGWDALARVVTEPQSRGRGALWGRFLYLLIG